jgi:hypothetical protein
MLPRLDHFGQLPTHIRSGVTFPSVPILGRPEWNVTNLHFVMPVDQSDARNRSSVIAPGVVDRMQFGCFEARKPLLCALRKPVLLQSVVMRASIELCVPS